MLLNFFGRILIFIHFLALQTDMVYELLRTATEYATIVPFDVLLTLYGYIAILQIY